MEQVCITGLDGAGPGDILGAIGGETDINPAVVGNIEINGSFALVEIPGDLSDRLISQLDGETIANSRVTLKPAAADEIEPLEEIEAYVTRFRHLVDLEREEEMREHEESIRTLSGRQRQAEGKAILDLRGRDEGEGLEGKRVKFLRQQQGRELPDTRISVGDLVMISRDDPLRDDNPTGTVVQKTSFSITAAFDNPPGFIYGKDLRMDLYVNDITYQRMKAALETLQTADGKLSELRDILLGLQPVNKVRKADIGNWFNTDLNQSQKNAVRNGIGAEFLHLVHGPPGTGKTTTLSELIRQAISSGDKVLASAASNTAVDNLLEFLVEQGVKAVRVGHPARVSRLLHEHTLDHCISKNEQYRRSEELRKQAFALKEEQEQFTRPSGRYRRGMSDNRIKQLAGQNRGSRGVPPETIREMARWLEIREQMDTLFEKADKLRGEAVNQVIDENEVICTTNSTAGSELLDGVQFDLVVIDEATQATEPGCLISITHGSKVVMAGDHKQLPPTVKSREATDKGLATTLFERLSEQHANVISMLRTQYRMHQAIMQFSSEQFYQGKLRADDTVRTHTLSDLDPDMSSVDPELQRILDPGEPVVFVDTARIDAAERSRMGSTSRENPEEARLVARMVEHLLQSGIDAGDIGIITPYNDQVDLLRRKLDCEPLEISSVDGFQGREKEVILISLTRSNPQNEIGFLEDVRRLNVSLTRARRKLIVLGDRDMVTTNRIYDQFYTHAAENGLVVTL
ncbi:MAG: IGHMBP2 family helicase [Balneolaceae bacterium]|nr:IGHMBP2 family helicase [Balneolaceae bacterium]